MEKTRLRATKTITNMMTKRMGFLSIFIYWIRFSCKKKKALERAKRAKEDAAAVIRLQKKKDGGSGAKDAEVEKLQAKTQE